MNEAEAKKILTPYDEHGRLAATVSEISKAIGFLAGVEAERLRAKPLVEFLKTLADAPVVDWCSDLCTKWPPANEAHKLLKAYTSSDEGEKK